MRLAGVCRQVHLSRMVEAETVVAHLQADLVRSHW